MARAQPRFRGPGRSLSPVAFFGVLLIGAWSSCAAAPPRRPPLPPRRPAVFSQSDAAPEVPPLPPRRPAGSLAAAQTPAEPPLPPTRPSDLGAPQPQQPPPPQQQAETRPLAPSASPEPGVGRCTPEGRGLMVAETQASFTAGDGCGIDSPVRLDAVILPDGSQVAISPPALMRCSLAESLARWIRADVAPAFAANKDRLVKVVDAGSYECRRRNGEREGKLSEHGKGNAIDLLSLATAKGESYAIHRTADPEPALREELMTQMKRTACDRFTTVLGPGSDGFHSTHLHVDLEKRSHDYRICEWNLPASGKTASEEGKPPARAASGKALGASSDRRIPSDR